MLNTQINFLVGLGQTIVGTVVEETSDKVTIEYVNEFYKNGVLTSNVQRKKIKKSFL